MKLQDAFVSESSKYYGSWKMIGYNMSTTNNVFTYAPVKADNSFTAGTAQLGTSGEIVWRATPNANLNDCLTTDKWQLKISAGGTSNNGAVYDAEVSGGPAGNCDILVPGFGKLDQSGVVTAAN